MSKQAIALIAALLIAAGLLVAGCGGDDNGDAGSPGPETTSTTADSGREGGGEAGVDDGEAGDAKTLTKAEFIKEADAICAESQRRITAAGTKFFKEAKQEPGNEQEQTQIELVETILMPEYEKVAEELSSLGLPSDDQGQAESVVDSYVEFSETVSENPRGFLKKGPGVESYEQTKELAKAYGFRECPQGV